MNVFTVSLFGHRETECLWQTNDQLTLILKDLIQTKSHVNFLIGRSGEFDQYAASVIKSVQKDMGKENNDIVLVLPYRIADMDYYEKYYDSVIIPEELYGVHPKSAITLRNKWMIERSDLVVVFVEYKNGGAYSAMKYAQKLDKPVINLCNRDE